MARDPREFSYVNFFCAAAASLAAFAAATFAARSAEIAFVDPFVAVVPFFVCASRAFRARSWSAVTFSDSPSSAFKSRVASPKSSMDCSARFAGRDRALVRATVTSMFSCTSSSFTVGVRGTILSRTAPRPPYLRDLARSFSSATCTLYAATRTAHLKSSLSSRIATGSMPNSDPIREAVTTSLRCASRSFSSPS